MVLILSSVFSRSICRKRTCEVGFLRTSASSWCLLMVWAWCSSQVRSHIPSDSRASDHCPRAWCHRAPRPPRDATRLGTSFILNRSSLFLGVLPPGSHLAVLPVNHWTDVLIFSLCFHFFVLLFLFVKEPFKKLVLKLGSECFHFCCVLTSKSSSFLFSVPFS